MNSKPPRGENLRGGFSMRKRTSFESVPCRGLDIPPNQRYPEKEIERIADHYLYFTSHCIIEAMHVHASDKKLTEADSGKFFVRADGSTMLQHRGDLTDREIGIIQRFIKENYLDMYKTWKEFGGKGFFEG